MVDFDELQGHDPKAEEELSAEGVKAPKTEDSPPKPEPPKPASGDKK